MSVAALGESVSGTGAPVSGCRLGGARGPATQPWTPHRQPRAKASPSSVLCLIPQPPGLGVHLSKKDF